MPKEIFKKNYNTKIENLIDKNDTLYYQKYLINTAFQSNSADERLQRLTKALSLTLPGFDIHQICSYRLTCEELSILNNIAHEYRHTKNSHLSSLYFLQILAYVQKTRPDVLMQSKFLPVTGYMYSRSLYMLKFYQETVALPGSFDISIMKYHINSYGMFLFFYCQALGESSRFEETHMTAIQAYAISILTERSTNASALKQYLSDDFTIELKY